MIQRLHQLTLFSYLSLLTLLLVWILLIPHGENYPTAAMLVLGILPLLLPLRGILHRRSYTYAWSGFLVLFYLAHGIVELYSGDAFWLLPLLEITLSLAFLTATNLCLRLLGKQKAAERTAL